ncbi:unnamed protein product [Closterium sp. NIES-54]
MGHQELAEAGERSTPDATAHLAVRNHLPLAEREHFSQQKTTKDLYDAVVARYSSPATAALGCLMLPYLFPELVYFHTVSDLMSHLLSSETRYRAVLKPTFLYKSSSHTSLTSSALKSALRLLLVGGAATARVRGVRVVGVALVVGVAGVVVVGAEAVEVVPEVEAVEAEGVVEAPGVVEAAGVVEEVGVELAGVEGYGGSARGGGGYGSGQQLPRLPDNPTPQQLCKWVVQRGSPGGSGRCPYVRRTGLKKSQTCGKGHIEYRCFDRLEDTWVAEYSDVQAVPNWLQLIGMGEDVYALDFANINVAIYALYVADISVEGACYSCVPCDAGVDAAAPCASASAATGASESAASESAASAEALHTFTLDLGASRCFFRDCNTVTPLSAPFPVSLADPSGGPAVARASTVLPCPAVPSGSLSGLHLPSFSMKLQRLRSMHSRLLVSGLLRSLPPLPSLPTPPCLPCVEGRQRAAPHSSSFPPTTAPLQTLHMDVWGPARVRGTDHERYFLLVVDDYSRYTTVFPLRSKAAVSGVVSSLLPRLASFTTLPRVEVLLPQPLTTRRPLATLLALRPPPDFPPRPSSSPPQPAAVDSGVAEGGDTGAEPVGAETGGAETRGAETGSAETGGVETEGADSGGAASPPVLYVDNKAMLALCQEQRLEHRTKHIALRYFLARELQQRGRLRLSYVASRGNTADVLTKAFGSGDHQRFCNALGLVPTVPGSWASSHYASSACLLTLHLLYTDIYIYTCMFTLARL